jgi:hypothetical protein
MGVRSCPRPIPLRNDEEHVCARSGGLHAWPLTVPPAGRPFLRKTSPAIRAAALSGCVWLGDERGRAWRRTLRTGRCCDRRASGRIRWRHSVASNTMTSPQVVVPRVQLPLAATLRCSVKGPDQPGSDLKPHLDDRLGNRAQAGVVVTGVRAYELVGMIDRDRVLLGGDPLGLFNDDP